MRSRPMSCEEVVDRLTAYLEGDLDAAERMSIERHVVICPPCRGHLSQVRAVLAATARLREAPPAPVAHDAVLAAFRALRDAGP